MNRIISVSTSCNQLNKEKKFSKIGGAEGREKKEKEREREIKLRQNQ